MVEFRSEDFLTAATDADRNVIGKQCICDHFRTKIAKLAPVVSANPRTCSKVATIHQTVITAIHHIYTITKEAKCREKSLARIVKHTQ